jgi:hypothetical protein
MRIQKTRKMRDMLVGDIRVSIVRKIPCRIGKYCGKKVQYSQFFLIISLLTYFSWFHYFSGISQNFLSFPKILKFLNFIICPFPRLFPEGCNSSAVVLTFPNGRACGCYFIKSRWNFVERELLWSGNLDLIPHYNYIGNVSVCNEARPQNSYNELNDIIKKLYRWCHELCYTHYRHRKD